jgi:3',5'-cyclic AMP phosphodiesterase CpdA
MWKIGPRSAATSRTIARSEGLPTLITLLHVSDLHIGERLRWLGSFAPRAAGRHPYNRPTDWGHDEWVAWDLANEWLAITNAQPAAMVVVTGDLTRSGTGLQFGLAHRYIHAHWLADAQIPLLIRLGASGTGALTIPGNHDFWGGVFPGPILWRKVLEGHFWPPAWLHVLEDTTENPFEIHFVGLDSCSGLWTLSPNQVLATGAIDSGQLAFAEALLATERQRAAARQRYAVPVVLVHHPPERLTPASRQDFENWLVKNQVRAILTGHTHVPAQHFLANAPACFELRCGTTLQAGTYNMLPGPKPNHFYLHTLRWTGGQPAVQWQSIEYWHTGSNWTTNAQLAWDESV